MYVLTAQKSSDCSKIDWLSLEIQPSWWCRIVLGQGAYNIIGTNVYSWASLWSMSWHSGLEQIYLTGHVPLFIYASRFAHAQTVHTRSWFFDFSGESQTSPRVKAIVECGWCVLNFAVLLFNKEGWLPSVGAGSSAAATKASSNSISSGSFSPDRERGAVMRARTGCLCVGAQKTICISLHKF